MKEIIENAGKGKDSEFLDEPMMITTKNNKTIDVDQLSADQL